MQPKQWHTILLPTFLKADASVDFRQPGDCSLEDSTAAAIAACGLLEIEKCVPEHEKDCMQMQRSNCCIHWQKNAATGMKTQIICWKNVQRHFMMRNMNFRLFTEIIIFWKQSGKLRGESCLSGRRNKSGICRCRNHRNVV